MAMDSELKRSSAVNFGWPVPLCFPPADGVIGEGNRAHLCNTYAFVDYPEPAGVACPFTISHLFDHEFGVWRKTESLDASGVTAKSFALLYGPLGCKANRKAAVIINAGPGIVDAGQRVFYLDVGPVILKRDLFELTAGPDAPAVLEVENVTIPRGHHVEVRCSEYHGPDPNP